MEKYPLHWPVGWPRAPKQRRSNFGGRGSRPSVGSATLLLMEEIQRLNGQSVREKHVDNFLLSTNIRLRQDGLPYSSQREPTDTGVAVYFKYKGKDTVIACDTFDNIGCNIYAIAKTIERIRDIERWGSSELMNRAFTGFLALPERGTQPTWYSILDLAETANVFQIKEKYKELSKKFHPDNPLTGDSEKFIQVKLAYDEAMLKF